MGDFLLGYPHDNGVSKYYSIFKKNFSPKHWRDCSGIQDDLQWVATLLKLSCAGPTQFKLLLCEDDYIYLVTSCACLENASALVIMPAVFSSSSPSLCPLSSSAILALVSSPITPPAAPFIPSMLPGPGMCWARLRDAFPAAASPTGNSRQSNRKHLSVIQIVAFKFITEVLILSPTSHFSSKRQTYLTLSLHLPKKYAYQRDCDSYFFFFF